jgi:hypothetical protein
MKQKYVLLIGLIPFFIGFGLVFYGVNIELLAPVLMISFPFFLGVAINYEVKNVENGEIDLSKQSKGNKVLTYTLTFLVFLCFGGPLVYHYFFSS